MKDNQSGAFIVSRRKPRDKSTSFAHKRIGGIIAALLFLSAVICTAVSLYPRLSKSSKVAVGFSKTYYFLAVGEEQTRVQAQENAQYAKEHGGAGYIYNDGKYHIVAAVYERETDVKTLVSVNADSHYFALDFSVAAYGDGDKRVLDYLTGEWFNTVFTAVTELDKGNIAESAAEHAVASAFDRLKKLAQDAETKAVNVVLSSFVFDPPQTQSVLSYLRYVNVFVVAKLHTAFV